MQIRRLISLAMALLTVACADPQLGLEPVNDTRDVTLPGHAQANAATYWNGVARELVKQYASNPYVAVRGYALVSLAQYHGAAATEPPNGHRQAFEHAAITQASVDVLSYLYPGEAGELADQAAAYLAATARPDARPDVVAAGAVAGAAGAAALSARAQTDGWFVPWTGTVPTGPGIWFSTASHDAKYTYWLIRPSQADAGIQLAVGLPNFPSYVSNHATLSSGMARVIGELFPSERARLDALAEEAAMSRLYGGIHYRFDNEAGLVLGRQIAAWGIAHDVRDAEVFVLE